MYTNGGPLSLSLSLYIYIYIYIYHLYLYRRVTRINGISIYYWMKLGWFIFLISLSHPCMYGKGNIRVLEGVVELRTTLLRA